MKKRSIREWLDFIPLIILTITAVLLIIARLNGEILLQWKHIFGLMILPLNWITFFRMHKLGVIFLGFTILIGLFGLISFSPAISIHEIWYGKDRIFPIFYGQSIFLLWLIIHMILSLRYYVGILTKKYWEELGRDINKKKINPN